MLQPSTPPPRLREQLHAVLRTKHYSLRTEKTYWYWIRYFIRFHRLRHPRDMAEPEVAQLLTWLPTPARCISRQGEAEAKHQHL